jgi:outer membrane protein assembly factor BamE (lipoprotein component of BamABCDE complex)
MRYAALFVLAAGLVFAGCSKSNKGSSSPRESDNGNAQNSAPADTGKAEGSPQSAGGAAAAEKFSRIVPGMTAQQVTEIMGPADGTFSHKEGKEDYQVMRWHTKQGEYVVQFKDSKVFASHAQNKQDASAENARLSSNWSKVQAGMTLAQVKDLLGTPSNQMDMNGIQALHYEDKNAEYVVQFKDGKVIMTHRNRKDSDD